MRKEIDNDDGVSYYYNDNNQLHKEDGPAIECYNEYEAWYFNGELHRENGPAIIYPVRDWDMYIFGPKEWINSEQGDKEWYYHGKLLNCSSQKEFKRLLKFKAFW